jgi:hypothetical protein
MQLLPDVRPSQLLLIGSKTVCLHFIQTALKQTAWCSAQ